jgi:hypothetical protein
MGMGICNLCERPEQAGNGVCDTWHWHSGEVHKYSSTLVVEESPEVQGLADHMSAIARLVCAPQRLPASQSHVNSLRTGGG